MLQTSPTAGPGGAGARSLLLVTLAVLAGCGGGQELPTPRPLVIHSGARIRPEPERLEEIDRWVTAELENIQEDPSFLIAASFTDSTVYPWEGLEIEGDTARIQLEATARDALTPFEIYAHLHLMETMGNLEEWLPEAPVGSPYELERAILGRVSDAWLLGRSVYDTAPYAPLEELLYSNESGWLEAFILTARPDAFPEARERWLSENPEAQEEYVDWFRETFSREPPGLRSEAADTAGVRR